MEAQYPLASVLFVLGPGTDILTWGCSPELPLPCSQPDTAAMCLQKEMADALPQNPLLPAPPIPPLLSQPSRLQLWELSFFLSFFILPAEHLPAGHSISFLVFGE